MKRLKVLTALILALVIIFTIGCQRAPDAPVNDTPKPVESPVVDASPTASVVPSDTPSPTGEPEASPSPAETAEEVPVHQLNQLSSGNGRFATELYRVLSKEQGNLFFSPYSISTALSMTYMGARGNTEAQMKKVLFFDMGQDKLPAVFGALSRKIIPDKKTDGCILKSANRIWVQKDFKILDSFTDICRKYYGAPLENINFKDNEASRETINKWVAEKTNNMIKDLIPKGVITDITRMVLTNAIYFKGNWAEKFDKKLTSKEPFHTLDGKTVQVDTMHRTGEILHSSSAGYSAVQLPYAGDRISMMIILPEKADGIKELDKNINFGLLDGMSKTMAPARVKLALPVFKAEQSISLKKTLENMGMNEAFSDAADFSGIEPTKSLKITEVIHKAFVAVDESGTEAAAATAVVMGTKEAEFKPIREIEFKVDRPFLFVIRDNGTGSILFMGRIITPQK